MTRAATADVSLFYADASALVKLIHEESATAALRSFVAEADLVTSDLALTEVARAIRRAAAAFPEVDMGQHLEQAAELFESIGLLPLDVDSPPPTLVVQRTALWSADARSGRVVPRGLPNHLSQHRLVVGEVRAQTRVMPSQRHGGSPALDAPDEHVVQ